MVNRITSFTINWIKASRITLLVIYDAVMTMLAMYVALSIRFDFIYADVAPEFLDSVRKYAPFNALCTVLIFVAIGLYNSLWSYAGIRELIMIV